MKDKKVLVLGLVNYPFGSAGARRVSGIVDLFVELGAYVDIVLYHPPGNKENYKLQLQKDKVRCFSHQDLVKEEANIKPTFFKRIINFFHVSFFLGLREVSFSNRINTNYDVVFVYGNSLVLNLAVLMNFKGAIKLYDIVEWDEAKNFPYCFINPIYYLKKINLRVCTKYYDGLIVISKYCESFFRRKGIETFLLPPVVSNFNGTENRGDGFDFHFDGEDIVIGYVGSPGRKESILDFLDAFSEYIEFMPDTKIKVLLVGGGLHNLSSKFELLIARGILVISSAVPHETAIQIVQKLDYSFVVRENSITNRAGFPSKVVESLSLGTPVIYSDYSDLSYYLTNEESGLITAISKPDFFSLLVKIEEKGKRVSIEMRKSAFKTYLTRFQPSLFGSGFLKFYNKLKSQKSNR